jgi:hypothetical protein
MACNMEPPYRYWSRNNLGEKLHSSGTHKKVHLVIHGSSHPHQRCDLHHHRTSTRQSSVERFCQNLSEICGWKLCLFCRHYRICGLSWQIIFLKGKGEGADQPVTYCPSGRRWIPARRSNTHPHTRRERRTRRSTVSISPAGMRKRRAVES